MGVMSDLARTLVGMCVTGSSAVEQANEAIRAFMRARAGRPLTSVERREYDRLLALWAEAVRAQLTTAA